MVEITAHVIYKISADSAYPISPTCMKPYHQPETDAKKRFNYRLSAIRTICTENLISLFKLRFQCLRRGIGTKIILASNIVLACAVIHNCCIMWNEPVPEEEDLEENGDEEQELTQSVDEQIGIRAAGQSKRDFLMLNFC
jgi:DDE superfamily endonuclease